MPTVAALLSQRGLPQLEARALLAHELRSTRETLVAHPEREVGTAAAARFTQLVARRQAGEPLAYLLGSQEFYSRSFAVSPAVLIPRPETELLVQLALDRARKLVRPRILDLGTGSGCIAISLALECTDAVVTATDMSRDALQIARINATTPGAQVDFIESDWYTNVAGSFDIIVSNPPYVAENDPHLAELKYEPAHALRAGHDGLSSLRKVIAGAPNRLKSGGWLLVEHGYDQAKAVRELFEQAGFNSIASAPDAAKIERTTMGAI